MTTPNDYNDDDDRATESERLHLFKVANGLRIAFYAWAIVVAVFGTVITGVVIRAMNRADQTAELVILIKERQDTVLRRLDRLEGQEMTDHHPLSTMTKTIIGVLAAAAVSASGAALKAYFDVQYIKQQMDKGVSPVSFATLQADVTALKDERKEDQDRMRRIEWQLNRRDDR